MNFMFYSIFEYVLCIHYIKTGNINSLLMHACQDDLFSKWEQVCYSIIHNQTFKLFYSIFTRSKFEKIRNVNVFT